MFKKYLINFYLIVNYCLVGYYIVESIYAYKKDGHLLYNNTTMIFVCLGLSILFLSFYIHNEIKNKKQYTPEKDKRMKYFSLSLFWVNLICTINYIWLLTNSGFATGKKLFWQLSSLILGLFILALYIHLFNRKKTYYL
ncbi:hypothetical protein EZY14_003860 [Kordia sp. TARA_039_SRF]|nr:hypothetical protein EZY14_003860 [Kordia sp. TARA_039_SRF]